MRHAGWLLDRVVGIDPGEAEGGMERVERADRIERTAIALAAVVLALFALWRIRLGTTFSDDGHYVALAMRLASGARVFTDEMNVQALGSLLAVPFTKAWLALAGVNGIALALRVFYVALAGATGLVVYRCFAPAFGRVPAFAGVAAVLFAPVYNIMSVSYNSIAILGGLLAVALAFLAIRERHPWAAVLSSVFLGLASLSYPPLVFAAAWVFFTAVILSPAPRVRAAFVAGAVLAAVVVIAYLASVTDVQSIRDTLGMGSAERSGRLFSLATLGEIVALTGATLIKPAVLPLVAVSALTAILPEGRWRLGALALIPVVAAIPGAVQILTGDTAQSYGVFASSYMVLLTFALVPWLVRRHAAGGDDDARLLLRLTGAAGVIGYLIVGLTTNSGWFWGMTFVGLAPLTASLVMLWAARLRDSYGPAASVRSAALLVTTVVVLYGLVVFKTGLPWHMTYRVTGGAYAGLVVDERMGEVIETLREDTRSLIAEDTEVFVIGNPGAYPVVGGRAYTPVLWHISGPVAGRTIQYFDERGRWPEVVVLKPVLETWDDLDDPLVERIRDEYRVVGESVGFTLMVAR